MQPAPGRRALSGLASKLHPQLPLSNKQSQHLLTLLTTSFREHLDREHPVAVPDRSNYKHTHAPPPKHLRRSSLPSSQSHASTHIESILTNPLFSTRPRRRGSNPSDAREALKDPLGWFDAQIASGDATLHKAVVYLELCERAAAHAQPQQRLKIKPGARVADWLRTSGEDKSKDFVDQVQRTLLPRMVPLLLSEGQSTPLWRWFDHSPEQRIKETGLDLARVQIFRIAVLKLMVESSLANHPTLDESLAVFLKAHSMSNLPVYGLTPKVFQSTGAILIKHILANPTIGVSPEIYQPFLQSASVWAGSWTPVIQSILWLHHPSHPSAEPGLAYIQDPKGAAQRVQGASLTMRQLLVQLCLGVARQLLAEQKITKAQVAIDFTRDHFPDLVMKKIPTTDYIADERKQQEREQGNIDMLNQLLPG